MAYAAPLFWWLWLALIFLFFVECGQKFFGPIALIVTIRAAVVNVDIGPGGKNLKNNPSSFSIVTVSQIEISRAVL